MSEIAATLLVSRAIVSENSRILLLQRSHDDSYNPGLWEFPGGKVDPGEVIEQALVREVYEETGLLVKASSSIAHVENELIEYGKYSGRLYVALFYAAQRLGGDLMLSREHDTARWYYPRTALNLDLAPESKRALEVFNGFEVI